MNYSEEITAELDEINHEFAEMGLDTRPTIVLPGTALPPTNTLSFPLLKAASVGMLGGLLFVLLHYYLAQ